MEEGNSSFFGGNKMIYDKYVELKNKDNKLLYLFEDW